MAKRILFSLILLGSTLLLPFWVSLILAIFGMFIFPNYLEAVFLACISDLIFGINEPKFFGITMVATLFTAILFILIGFIKKKLKFYQKD